MKKFQFSLEKVLSYKQQRQDALRSEHAEILAQVHAQEALVESLWKRYREYGAEYRERCECGLPMTEVLVYQSGLRAMEREIQGETKQLEQLRERAEAKRKEVVEAKQETAAIEKLKEKKVRDYQKALEKSEEAFIEEFVSTSRVRAAAN